MKAIVSQGRTDTRDGANRIGDNGPHHLTADTASDRRRWHIKTDSKKNLGALHHHWVRDINEFGQMAADWDRALIRSGEDNPFLLSSFVTTWWQCFGDGRALDIFVLYRGDEIVGGVPLYHWRPGLLEYPGELAANYTECLAVEEPALVWESLLGALEARHDWSRLELHRVRQTRLPMDPTLPTPCDGVLVDAETTDYAFAIEIPADPSQVLTHVQKKLRRQVKKALKEAARLGKLSLWFPTTDLEFERLLKTFIHFSQQAFKCRGMTSLFEDVRAQRFFIEFSRRCWADGYAEAQVLKLDDCIMAINFGYSLANSINGVWITFNPEYMSLSPGHLLRYKLAELGSQRGAQLIDIYTGDSTHKHRWGKHREPTYLIQVRPSTMGGRVRQATARRVRRTKSAVKSNKRLYPYAQTIKYWFRCLLEFLGRKPENR